MPLTINDYWLVTTMFDTNNEPFQNRYFFQGVAGSFTAADLADAFDTDVWPHMAQAVSNTMSALTIEVKSRTDPTDFAEITSALFPAAPGSVLPGFVASGHTWATTDLNFVEAKKRIGRHPQLSLATSGNDWDVATQAQFVLFGNAIAVPIEGVLGSYQYAQTQRSGGTLVDAISVGPYKGAVVTSQNTRKAF